MLLIHTSYLGSDFQLYRGDIRIEGSLIVAIEENLKRIEGEEVIDCSSHLIYPALADCHTHTPDTLFRGLFSDKPLHSWCDDTAQGRLQQQLFNYTDQAVSSPDFRTLVLYAYLQYLKGGVACIIETGQADESSQALEACAIEIGIKALVDWYDEVPENEISSDALARGTHLPEEEELEQGSLGEAIERVQRTSWPLMTHCLETEFRRTESLRKFGLSTIELLDLYKLLNEQAILFHCIETTEADRALLASSKALVVHCPISNRISSAHEMALSDLLDKGARIGLGTDFLTHDIWEVMRTTYAELKQSERANLYTASTVWKLATTSPCPAIYQGSIAVGMRADLLFVRNACALSPLIQSEGFSNTAYNTLMHTRAELIDSVMVDGKFVIRNGTCTTVDEAALEKAYAEILRRVYASHLT